MSLAIVSASVGMIMILAGAIGPKEKLSLRTYAMLALAMGLTIIPFTVIQSPLSSTMPIDAPMNFLENPSPARFSIPIGPIARLDPSQASITFSPGRRFVQIEPLLTFNQRSPDGTWTIFARRKDRAPATRRLKGVRSEDGNVCAEYDEKEDNDFVPQARSVLRIRSAATDAFEIEASTSLGRIVYSHLNTFTQITLAGHKQLRIAFSPIPVQRFDVAHAGYPFGKPSQFAFLGADKQLHVVQTSSGEKGPFHELGAGPLDGPLTISFFDGDERLFDVEFADWATQASTEASPAAGWGVPQNAIEFGLLSDDPKSPASVFISLAATSVGRGWSSVGHRAGAYSNRMTVRLAGNPPPSKKVAN